MPDPMSVGNAVRNPTYFSNVMLEGTNANFGVEAKSIETGRPVEGPQDGAPSLPEQDEVKSTRLQNKAVLFAESGERTLAKGAEESAAKACGLLDLGTMDKLMDDVGQTLRARAESRGIRLNDEVVGKWTRNVALTVLTSKTMQSLVAGKEMNPNARLGGISRENVAETMVSLLGLISEGKLDPEKGDHIAFVNQESFDVGDANSMLTLTLKTEQQTKKAFEDAGAWKTSFDGACQKIKVRLDDIRQRAEELVGKKLPEGDRLESRLIGLLRADGAAMSPEVRSEILRLQDEARKGELELTKLNAAADEVRVARDALLPESPKPGSKLKVEQSVKDKIESARSERTAKAKDQLEFIANTLKNLGVNTDRLKGERLSDAVNRFLMGPDKGRLPDGVLSTVRDLAAEVGKLENRIDGLAAKDAKEKALEELLAFKKSYSKTPKLDSAKVKTAVDAEMKLIKLIHGDAAPADANGLKKSLKEAFANVKSTRELVCEQLTMTGLIEARNSVMEQQQKALQNAVAPHGKIVNGTSHTLMTTIEIGAAFQLAGLVNLSAGATYTSMINVTTDEKGIHVTTSKAGGARVSADATFDVGAFKAGVGAAVSLGGGVRTTLNFKTVEQMNEGVSNDLFKKICSATGIKNSNPSKIWKQAGKVRQDAFVNRLERLNVLGRQDSVSFHPTNPKIQDKIKASYGTFKAAASAAAANKLAGKTLGKAGASAEYVGVTRTAYSYTSVFDVPPGDREIGKLNTKLTEGNQGIYEPSDDPSVRSERREAALGDLEKLTKTFREFERAVAWELRNGVGKWPHQKIDKTLVAPDQGAQLGTILEDMGCDKAKVAKALSSHTTKAIKRLVADTLKTFAQQAVDLKEAFRIHSQDEGAAGDTLAAKFDFVYGELKGMVMSPSFSITEKQLRENLHVESKTTSKAKEVHADLNLSLLGVGVGVKVDHTSQTRPEGAPDSPFGPSETLSVSVSLKDIPYMTEISDLGTALAQKIIDGASKGDVVKAVVDGVKAFSAEREERSKADETKEPSSLDKAKTAMMTKVKMAVGPKIAKSQVLTKAVAGLIKAYNSDAETNREQIVKMNIIKVNGKWVLAKTDLQASTTTVSTKSLSFKTAYGRHTSVEQHLHTQMSFIGDNSLRPLLDLFDAYGPNPAAWKTLSGVNSVAINKIVDKVMSGKDKAYDEFGVYVTMMESLPESKLTAVLAKYNAAVTAMSILQDNLSEKPHPAGLAENRAGAALALATFVSAVRTATTPPAEAA